MKTVVFANQEGGVAKTACACLLAHHLSHGGLRVLAVDLDHQENMSKPLERSGRVVVSSVRADQLFTEGLADIDGVPFALVGSGAAFQRRGGDDPDEASQALRDALDRGEITPEAYRTLVIQRARDEDNETSGLG